MEIDVIKFKESDEATLSRMYIDGKFYCYVLEDQHQDVKVIHETRIPEGRYRIDLRTVGGFNQRYSKKYGSMHQGMLELQDVPNFKYVLIHTGNTDDHTSGCLLVGKNVNIVGDLMVTNSRTAYKEIYPIILGAIKKGEEVWVSLKRK